MTDATTLNLTDLARARGCSVPALKHYLASRPDFPVLERGGNGKAYKFDPVAVQRYFEAEREAKRQEEAEKEQHLGPLGEMFGAEAEGRSADQLAKDIANRHRLNDLALKEGLLVPSADMSRELTAIFDWLGRTLGEIPAKLQREHGLSAAVVSSMEDNIDDMRRMLHEKIVRIANNGVVPDEAEPGLFEAAQ